MIIKATDKLLEMEQVATMSSMFPATSVMNTAASMNALESGGSASKIRRRSDQTILESTRPGRSQSVHTVACTTGRWVWRNPTRSLFLSNTCVTSIFLLAQRRAHSGHTRWTVRLCTRISGASRSPWSQTAAFFETAESPNVYQATDTGAITTS